MEEEAQVVYQLCLLWDRHIFMEERAPKDKAFPLLEIEAVPSNHQDVSPIMICVHSVFDKAYFLKVKGFSSSTFSCDYSFVLCNDCLI